MENNTIGGKNKMADLDKKIEDATVEKALRYPLVKVKENLTEIRLISEAAQDYITKMDPDIIRPSRWEVIPQITIDFLKAIFQYLGERKRTDVAEVYINIGNIMRVSIEYAGTMADKEGTLNPKISIGSDMDINTVEYDDTITFEQSEILKVDDCEHLPIQFFDDRKVIKEIAMSMKSKLYTNSGIKITDKSWAMIPCALVSFFRCAKTWLIEHKDDGPCGMEINLGNCVTIGVQKEGLDDDDVEYFIYITPGQTFKLSFAKGDAETELEQKG